MTLYSTCMQHGMYQSFIFFHNYLKRWQYQISDDLWSRTPPEDFYINTIYFLKTHKIIASYYHDGHIVEEVINKFLFKIHFTIFLHLFISNK